MKISVVIPVRNAAALLDRCLSSFYPLSPFLMEIVVVDCCSTDGIENVFARHLELPIIHLRGPDKGIYDAFNKGAIAAKSELIFFLGADDSINLQIFEATKKFGRDCDVLVGAITKDGVPERWRPMLGGVRLLFRNIPHQGMLLRKKLIIERPYSLRYPILSDYAWNIESFWSGTVRYRFVSDTFCEWAPGGVSHTARDLNFELDKSGLLRKNLPLPMFAVYLVGRALRNLLGK